MNAIRERIFSKNAFIFKAIFGGNDVSETFANPNDRNMVVGN